MDGEGIMSPRSSAVVPVPDLTERLRQIVTGRREAEGGETLADLHRARRDAAGPSALPARAGPGRGPDSTPRPSGRRRALEYEPGRNGMVRVQVVGRFDAALVPDLPSIETHAGSCRQRLPGGAGSGRTGCARAAEEDAIVARLGAEFLSERARRAGQGCALPGQGSETRIHALCWRLSEWNEVCSVSNEAGPGGGGVFDRRAGVRPMTTARGQGPGVTGGDRRSPCTGCPTRWGGTRSATGSLLVPLASSCTSSCACSDVQPGYDLGQRMPSPTGAFGRSGVDAVDALSTVTSTKGGVQDVQQGAGADRGWDTGLRRRERGTGGDPADLRGGSSRGDRSV